MIRIGCHLSPSRGLFRMGQDALSIRANTFQFFLRNPRGSKAKELDLDDAAALMNLLRERDMLPIVAHAPYTLNPRYTVSTAVDAFCHCLESYLSPKSTNRFSFIF